MNLARDVEPNPRDEIEKQLGCVRHRTLQFDQLWRVRQRTLKAHYCNYHGAISAGCKFA